MFPLRTLFRFCTTKQSLLKTSLSYVNLYGWNERAITAACLDLRISTASQGIISSYDLISQTMSKWDRQTLKHLDDWNFDGQKGIKNKVALAIKTRLSHEIPYIDSWNQAMAVGARPQYVLQTQKKLWNFADEIWIRCGDTSTDYNYYTKRFLFESVYVSTELFMLTDKSTDFKSTWEFMDRRLNDILKIGKGVGSTISTLGVMVEGIATSVRGVLLSYPNKVQHPIQDYKRQFEESERYKKQDEKNEGQTQSSK